MKNIFLISALPFLLILSSIVSADNPFNCSSQILVQNTTTNLWTATYSSCVLQPNLTVYTTVIQNNTIYNTSFNDTSLGYLFNQQTNNLTTLINSAYSASQINASLSVCLSTLNQIQPYFNKYQNLSDQYVNCTIGLNTTNQLYGFLSSDAVKTKNGIPQQQFIAFIIGAVLVAIFMQKKDIVSSLFQRNRKSIEQGAINVHSAEKAMEEFIKKKLDNIMPKKPDTASEGAKE